MRVDDPRNTTSKGGGQSVNAGRIGADAGPTPAALNELNRVAAPGHDVRNAAGPQPVFRLDAAHTTGHDPAAANVAGVGADVPPPAAGEAARLRWAAEQLESLFIHQLLKSMRSTVMKTGMFDGPGVKMFEEMLDEERAQDMARAGGLGLAQLIYEQMSQHTPVADASRTTRPVGENKSQETTEV